MPRQVHRVLLGASPHGRRAEAGCRWIGRFCGKIVPACEQRCGETLPCSLIKMVRGSESVVGWVYGFSGQRTTSNGHYFLKISGLLYASKSRAVRLVFTLRFFA